MRSSSPGARELARPRSGRTGVVVVAIVAVLVALVLAWRLVGATDAPPIEPVAADATQRVEPRASVREPDASELDVRDVATDAPASARNALPGEPTASALVGAPVEVLVVDATTDAPVAGALVRWTSVEPGLPEPTISLMRRGNAPTTLPEDAPIARTDSRGIALADSRLLPGKVEASSAGRWGMAYTNQASARPIRLAIAADATLAIEVVDDAGHVVAGVPVCVRDTSDARPFANLWSAVTDDRGLARVEHAQQLAGGAPERTPVLYACLDFPLRMPIQEPIDRQHLPSSPVRLVLPPCGSVVVGLHDADGTPVTVREIVLAPLEDGTADMHWTSGGRSYEPASIVRGEARYPFVGLGLNLQVRAFRTSGSATTSGLGPQTAGEVVRLELDLGPRERELIARLLDETRAPIRDRRVHFALLGTNVSSSAAARTDAEGRIRLALPSQALRSVSIALRGDGPAEGANVVVSLAGTDLRQDVDLGDVVLSAPRVFAAGRIVDDLGRPVEEALLVVHASAPDVDGGAWRSSERLLTKVDPGGTFEVLMRGEVARVRVAATRKGYADSGLLELDPGHVGIELVLPRACEIGGRVLVDDGVDATRIRVRALVTGAPRPSAALGSDRETPIGHDGVFRLNALPPGRFDLEFVSAAKSAVLKRIEGVDVPPAGKALDVRLDAIDLRGIATNPPAK